MAAIEARLTACGITSNMPLVAIPPSAGTKIKQWPAENFSHVANHLAKKYGAGIVIIGGPRDIEESERMIQALNKDVRYFNAVGQSLDELKATLSRVSLIVGNDSGPIYVAEAYGAKTLVLVGPTDEAEHPLQDDRHMVIVPKTRGDALLRSYISSEETIDTDVARAQIEAITVEEVIEAVDTFMARS
jgi:ADP-heptose:LPS heptosyltransferase